MVIFISLFLRRSHGKNPKSEIRNPKSEIRNPKSEIRNPKSEIRNPKSEIRNPKSEIYYRLNWLFQKSRQKLLFPRFFLKHLFHLKSNLFFLILFSIFGISACAKSPTCDLQNNCPEEKKDTRIFPLGDGTFKVSSIEYDMKTSSGNLKHTDDGASFTQNSNPFGVIVKWNEKDQHFDLKYVGSATIKYFTGGKIHDLKCKKDFVFSWDLKSNGVLANTIVSDYPKSDECQVFPMDIHYSPWVYDRFWVKSEGIPDGFIVEYIFRSKDIDSQYEIKFERVSNDTSEAKILTRNMK